MHHIHMWLAPKYLSDCFHSFCSAASGRYRLRSTGSAAYVLPKTRTKFRECGFFYSSPAAWNTLPSDLHDTTDKSTFQKRLKNVLFDRAYNWLLLVLLDELYSSALQILRWLIDWLMADADHSLFQLITWHIHCNWRCQNSSHMAGNRYMYIYKQHVFTELLTAAGGVYRQKCAYLNTAVCIATSFHFFSLPQSLDWSKKYGCKLRWVSGPTVKLLFIKTTGPKVGPQVSLNPKVVSVFCVDSKSERSVHSCSTKY